MKTFHATVSGARKLITFGFGYTYNEYNKITKHNKQRLATMVNIMLS